MELGDLGAISVHSANTGALEQDGSGSAFQHAILSIWNIVEQQYSVVLNHLIQRYEIDRIFYRLTIYV